VILDIHGQRERPYSDKDADGFWGKRELVGEVLLQMCNEVEPKQNPPPF